MLLAADEMRAETNRMEGVARLAARGFEFSQEPIHSVLALLPWSFPQPTSDIVVARGRIDDAEVTVVDYVSTLIGNSGGSAQTGVGPSGASSLHTVVIVQHPRITGRASVVPEPSGWSSWRRAVEIVSWVPPFVALRGAAWLLARLSGFPVVEGSNVGDPAFERLYRVYAASDEIARYSVPPSLREHLKRMRWFVHLEIRDGAVMYAAPRTGFGASDIDAVLRPARELLAACLSGRGAPMR